MAEDSRTSDSDDLCHLLSTEGKPWKWNGTVEELRTFITTTHSLKIEEDDPKKEENSYQFKIHTPSAFIKFWLKTRTLLIQGKESEELKKRLAKNSRVNSLEKSIGKLNISTIQDSTSDESSSVLKEGTSDGSEKKCNCNNEIYPDVHIKKREDGVKILGARHQFCAAFYHVHEWNERNYSCLDEEKCIIANEAKKPKGWMAQPRTVVAVVKFAKKDGSIVYEARYTNCQEDTKHAEDFFEEDVEDDLVNKIEGGTITMYLTLQPCNRSTTTKPGGTQGTKPNHSCCETLKNIYESKLQKKEVKLRVKPTHFCRLEVKNEDVDDDRDYEPHEPFQQEDEKTKNEHLRRNAVRGLKMLRRHQVNVDEMTPDDWKYLDGLTDGYSPSHVRQSLDNVIRANLQRLEAQVQRSKKES